MGKAIIAIILFMVLWMAYCEGRYYEQIKQAMPPAFNETDHALLIEKALQEAEAYHAAESHKISANNPGNLRDDNGDFKRFATPRQGYNAMVLDIKTKLSGNSRMMQAKYGKKYKPTIRRVITVYAPPHENNTKNYIAFVSKHSAINPDKVLTTKDTARLIVPMIHMEQGHKKAAEYKQYAER